MIHMSMQCADKAWFCGGGMPQQMARHAGLVGAGKTILEITNQFSYRSLLPHAYCESVKRQIEELKIQGIIFPSDCE